MTLENLNFETLKFENLNFETLKFEKQGPIGILSINRPKALNALNKQVLGELERFIKAVSENFNESKVPEGEGVPLRVLVLTGEGKAFVAGADIKEMQGHSEAEALEMAQRGQAIFQQIEDCPYPIVAAVNGFALGGGLELAMSCDFIIASSRAKMGLPEVSLGLIPGYGGTQRLSRYVGKALARRIALTGDIYSADQLMQWGLVTEVVPPEELMEASLKVATTLSRRSPSALALAKGSINQGYNLNQLEGLQLEARLFAKTFTTQDSEEGLAAFIEKREPNFTGN